MIKKLMTENRNRIRLLAALLILLLLAGCGRITETGETEPVSFKMEDPQPETVTVSEETEEKEVLTANRAEIALSFICSINGCSMKKLNTVYDSDGYLTFLGNKFTLKKIRTPEDAMGCLEELSVLCGLEGLQFQFSRKDISPVSGFTYYTIRQVVSGEIQEQPISYFNNQIKIFVDKNYNSAGFTCDVNRSPVDSLIEDKLIGRGDAEAFVKTKIADGSRILSEYSELVFWTDSNIASEKDSETVVPVWRIYTNEPREGKAYTVYLVYAYSLDNAAQEYTLIGIQPVQSPSVETGSTNYTSELFFAGMQAAGEFTYELNMSWQAECNPGYEAKNTMTVSVPVMYDPVGKTYYLADFNEKIAVTNYSDFSNEGQLNPVISTNPYDLNSWHFQNGSSVENRAYFFDPNYILASYSTMIRVYSANKERYGFDSVDTTGLPILLNVYYYEGAYPDVPNGFYPGAMNCGRQKDWAVFVTSPTCAGSADFGTLARAYADGLHTQLTCSQNLNEQGAVSAGYADAVGELLAYLNGAKYERYKWLVGSQCAEPVGSFFNPYDYRQAKYIGGAYYVSPVSDRFSVYTGSGGVRANCGVVNYLTFSMCKSSDSNASVLSFEQNLDLWFETVYCMNYQSGFEDLGAYLRYCAQSIGSLTKEQISYVNETTELLGFGGSKEKLEELIAKESNQKITIRLLSDDAEDIRVSALLSGGRNMGMTDDDGLLTYLCPKIDDNIELQVLWKGAMVGKSDLGTVSGSKDYIIESHVLTAKAGTEYDFGSEVILSESILQDKVLLPDEEGNVIRRSMAGEQKITFTERGIVCILTENKKQEKNSLYVIRVEEE